MVFSFRFVVLRGLGFERFQLLDDGQVSADFIEHHPVDIGEAETGKVICQTAASEVVPGKTPLRGAYTFFTSTFSEPPDLS